MPGSHDPRVSQSQATDGMASSESERPLKVARESLVELVTHFLSSTPRVPPNMLALLICPLHCSG